MAQRLQDRPGKPKREKKDLKTVLKGGIAAYTGFKVLSMGAVMISEIGLFGIPLALFGLWLVVMGLRVIAGKKKETERKRFRGREDTFTPSRPAAKTSFREADYRRIVPSGRPPVEKQLEQLEILRGAGLYTKEEYFEKKREILGQR